MYVRGQAWVPSMFASADVAKVAGLFRLMGSRSRAFHQVIHERRMGDGRPSAGLVMFLGHAAIRSQGAGATKTNPQAPREGAPATSICKVRITVRARAVHYPSPRDRAAATPPTNQRRLPPADHGPKPSCAGPTGRASRRGEGHQAGPERLQGRVLKTRTKYRKRAAGTSPGVNGEGRVSGMARQKKNTAE